MKSRLTRFGGNRKRESKHIAFFWLYIVEFKWSKLLVIANEDLGLGENLYRSLLDALRNMEQDVSGGSLPLEPVHSDYGLLQLVMS